MKKYNVINKEQVIELFNELKPLTKQDIANRLNTSLYQVINIIDELKDDDFVQIIIIPRPNKLILRKYIKK